MRGSFAVRGSLQQEEASELTGSDLQNSEGSPCGGGRSHKVVEDVHSLLLSLPMICNSVAYPEK